MGVLVACVLDEEAGLCVHMGQSEATVNMPGTALAEVVQFVGRRSTSARHPCT